MMKVTNLRRAREPDMSSAAIDQRLRDVAQLYKLGMSIQRAKHIGPVEKIDKAERDCHSPNVNDKSRT